MQAQTDMAARLPSEQEFQQVTTPNSRMETSHLKNAVAMLRRAGAVTTDEYLSCLTYARSGDTPDGAAMAAEAEADSMRPCEVLAVLERELESRRTE